MKIALFPTCIADVIFPQATQATVHLLECLGYEVYFLGGQGCCSQMHANTGYYPEAMSLIRSHANTSTPVLNGQWDAIVAPSGSCTGSLRHQASLIARDQGEPRLAAYTKAPAKKTYDLPELLVNVLGMVNVDAYFLRGVTYHITYHSLRMARIGDTATRFIAAVRGIDYVPLSDSDICCGFGGTSSLKSPEISAVMLFDKMANAIPMGAEIVVIGDYSCPVNIGGSLARSGSGIRPMHLVEVLAGTEGSPWSAPAINAKIGA